MDMIGSISYSNENSTCFNPYRTDFNMLRSPLPPQAPTIREEMETAAFDAMMEEGLSQAQAGQGVPLNEAFNLLHKQLEYVDVE